MGRIAIPKVLLALLISSLLITSFLALSIPFTAQGIPEKALGNNVLDLEGGNSFGGQIGNGPQSSIPDYREAMSFFIENKGQFDSEVRFVAVTEFGKAFFCDSEVQYLLERYEDGNLSGIDVITLTFPCAELISPQGMGLQPHFTNYFIGEQSQWVSGARNYRSMVYQDLWPGIDLVYKFSDKGLKYEFKVDPHVSEQRIGIMVEGATVHSDGSSLTFDTGYGRLVDSEIVSYQDDDLEILSSGFLATGNVVTFQVEGRDLSKALLIDPLLYSTYVGGSAYDFSQAIAIDPLGNAYITGQTQSANFPTIGPFQGAYAGNSDAFILKFDATGGSLLYSTYLGGSGVDNGKDLVVDDNGNVYLTGSTASTNFPTFNPLQTTFGGGNYDAFLLKIDATGNTLAYSTYLGGSGEDVGNSIAIDGGGNAYVTGYTSSSDFPIAIAMQVAKGGTYDAFVLKMNNAGNALIYSTYLGGSDNDYGQGVAVGSGGNAYVTGYTFSTDFPTKDPYQASNAGGGDAFVLKLNAIGGDLVYSTYIGGGLTDYGQGIALDVNGNAYLVGSTESTDFPTSLGSLQDVNAGDGDVFVLKIDPMGNSLIYSTYMGGSLDDVGMGIAVDATGNAYVTGYTNSTDLPTSRPFQATNRGFFDAFVFGLNMAGNDLLVSTFIGGEFTDAGFGVALDANGGVYVTGGTYSTDFPVVSSFQANNAGDCDAFVLKFNLANSALLHSTFAGGGAEDQGQAIALDAMGYMYIAGYTYSTTFPTTTGPLQGNNEGEADVFVMKIDPAGGALIYSTYIGGSLDDVSIDIAVDADGNAYVTGYTYSTDFPTSSPLQALNGGYYDAFVLKLSAAGNDLTYSTYIGGSDTDYGQGIVVDGTGNAYVAGGTFSDDFPTSIPFITNNSGGCDGFVLKLNAAGHTLIFSTYIGGGGDDQGLDIAIDAQGNAFVTGDTNSTDFPTLGPLQAENGGANDAFVLKLNSIGNALVYSTYVGGGGDDQGKGIVVDPLGNAFVTGDTNSTDFPLSGPYQALKRDYSDAFVLKIDSAGSVLIYSTFLGGDDDDTGYSLALDDFGNVYVTGSTFSLDFPTSCPLQRDNGGGWDAFVLKLDRQGAFLIYSTYVGGSDDDYGLGIAIDEGGSAYVTGGTYSIDFPTSSPLQTALGGDEDAFVLKLGSLGLPSSPLNLVATPGNGQVGLAWSMPSDDGGYPIDYYVVYKDGIDVAHPVSKSMNVTGLTNGVSYTFAVAAHNSIGIGPLTIMVSATPSAQAGVPGVPTDLMVTTGDSKVMLSWSVPGSGGTGIDYYIIYSNGVDVKHSTALSSDVLGLTNGVEYSFTVAAHNAAGTGPKTEAELAIPNADDQGGSGGDNLLILLGVMAAIIVVALVAFFAFRSRKRSGSIPVKPPEPVPPPAVLNNVPPPPAVSAVPPPAVINNVPPPPAVSTVPPPMEEPRFCPWCGERSSGEFCDKCGRKVE